MHMDDLALVSDSEAGLQYMLDIVTRYAAEWRSELNALKSAIMVFGESKNSRDLLRQMQCIKAGYGLRSVCKNK